MSLLSCRFAGPVRFLIVVAAMTMGAGFAAAQSVSTPTLTPHVGPSSDDPPCFCWADGRKIAEGVTVCLRTATGRRLAACDRVTNVMSWRISDEICPES
jgi:hypothetical protein